MESMGPTKNPYEDLIARANELKELAKSEKTEAPPKTVEPSKLTLQEKIKSLFSRSTSESSQINKKASELHRDLRDLSREIEKIKNDLIQTPSPEKEGAAQRKIQQMNDQRALSNLRTAIMEIKKSSISQRNEVKSPEKSRNIQTIVPRKIKSLLAAPTFDELVNKIDNEFQKISTEADKLNDPLYIELAKKEKTLEKLEMQLKLDKNVFAGYSVTDFNIEKTKKEIDDLKQKITKAEQAKLPTSDQKIQELIDQTKRIIGKNHPSGEKLTKPLEKMLKDPEIAKKYEEILKNAFIAKAKLEIDVKSYERDNKPPSQSSEELNKIRELSYEIQEKISDEDRKNFLILKNYIDLKTGSGNLQLLSDSMMLAVLTPGEISSIAGKAGRLGTVIQGILKSYPANFLASLMINPKALDPGEWEKLKEYRDNDTFQGFYYNPAYELWQASEWKMESSAIEIGVLKGTWTVSIGREEIGKKSVTIELDLSQLGNLNPMQRKRIFELLRERCMIAEGMDNEAERTKFENKVRELSFLRPGDADIIIKAGDKLSLDSLMAMNKIYLEIGE